MRIANCPINTDFISVSSESGTGNECFQGDVGGLIACTFENLKFLFFILFVIYSLSLSPSLDDLINFIYFSTENY